MPVLERFDTGTAARDVLLAHDFADGLRLITLIAGGQRNGQVAPSTLAAAFPRDARVALAGKSFTYTDVQVGGVSLDGDALAALPGGRRTALRDAQQTQLLAAAKQCLSAEWLGGLLTLRKCDAVVSFPQLEVSLHALDAFVASDKSGGRVTLQTCEARTHQAEALEAQGRHLEADKLYKKNIDDDLRSPGVVLTPPLMWSYYGIALRKGGRSAEAVAAYEAGLRALAGHVHPDTPQWREHNRILLCCRLITVHALANNEAGRSDAISRLFSGPLMRMRTCCNAAPRHPVAPCVSRAHLVSTRHRTTSSLGRACSIRPPLPTHSPCAGRGAATSPRALRSRRVPCACFWT